MEEDGPTEECEVCGGTDFHKEAGHFYCNECQTQSQQIREQVFEQEANTQSMKKIQKEKAQKSEDQLTSWECFNVVLKGLTEELIGLGAKHEIKSVVKCLWMVYLHKCEVFDPKSNSMPKVSILGSKKDIQILYNVKKRKRRAPSTSSTLSVKRQQSRKRRALITSQYEELSQSQSLTQDNSMSETLSTLKTGSEKSDSSGEIEYNSHSNAQLKRVISKEHQKEHIRDLDNTMSCHKWSTKNFPESFTKGPTTLTPTTLYAILYIALLIVEDTLQLSDLLRFIKEGHLSFGCYRHFFDEDIPDKSLNLPSKKNDKLFTNDLFRTKTASLVHFLKVEKYIKKPNLVQLCSRYCAELNLPNEIFKHVEKLICKTAPKMVFNKKSREIPNYEGRALSFILFTLKLLFGLDGVTEKKFSTYATMLNKNEVEHEMFDIQEWLKYIRYRDTVVKSYHVPSSLHVVDSDKYLDYIRNQGIYFKSPSRYVHREVRDYMEILDKLLENDCDETASDGIKFEHSLTPFLSYINIILDRADSSYDSILKRNFSTHSLDFLLRPNEFLRLLGNELVKNGGANDNFVIEDALYIDKIVNSHPCNTPVVVKIYDGAGKDRFMEEYLKKNASLKPTDVGVFLSNWQEGNEKQFARNKDLLKLCSECIKVPVKDDTPNTDVYPEHYNPFERYWLNIPTNPAKVRRYITKSRMQQIMSKLPYPFKLILEECVRVVEEDLFDFYAEFLVTELNLVYFGRFSAKCKNKKMPELQKVLNDCYNKW